PAPRDCGLQIVSRQQLALVRERFGLARAAECEQRTGEQSRRACCVDAEAELAKSFVRTAQAFLGRSCIAFEQLDASCEDVGFEDTVRDTEILDHLARQPAHPACSVGPSPHCFEDALTAER